MTPDPIRRRISLTAVVALFGAILTTTAAAGPPNEGVASVSSGPAAQVSFAENVQPIFQQRCVQCHGGAGDDGEVRKEASLDLTTYESAMAGSEFGTVIEAGDVDGSYLIEMIVAGDMPEEGDLVPEEEIQVIKDWIAAGAPNN